MSIAFDKIDECKTWVFPVNLNNSNGSWTATINSLGFQPDCAIIRQISYTQSLATNTDVPYETFVIMSNMSGNIDYVGSFNLLSTPFNIAGKVGSVGSITHPKTTIKIYKQVQNVNFQVMSPVASQSDQLEAVSSLSGDLVILVEFIKLRKSK